MNRGKKVIIALGAVFVFVIGGFWVAGTSGTSFGEYYSALVVASTLHDLINVNRMSGHMVGLRRNVLLEKAATMKAQDMVRYSYFDHTSPIDGATPWKWIEKAGYEYSYAGENLAVGFMESEQVSRAWMESIMHRENIMNGNFTEVGIGIATGTYKNKPAVYVVQMFGKPSSP